MLQATAIEQHIAEVSILLPQSIVAFVILMMDFSQARNDKIC
jgi:hypothetical protein